MSPATAGDTRKNYMATTLADLLRDFSVEILENEHKDYEDQTDPEVIVQSFLEVIKRRLIGD